MQTAGDNMSSSSSSDQEQTVTEHDESVEATLSVSLENYIRTIMIEILQKIRQRLEDFTATDFQKSATERVSDPLHTNDYIPTFRRTLESLGMNRFRQFSFGFTTGIVDDSSESESANTSPITDTLQNTFQILREILGKTTELLKNFTYRLSIVGKERIGSSFSGKGWFLKYEEENGQSFESLKEQRVGKHNENLYQTARYLLEIIEGQLNIFSNLLNSVKPIELDFDVSQSYYYERSGNWAMRSSFPENSNDWEEEKKIFDSLAVADNADKIADQDEKESPSTPVKLRKDAINSLKSIGDLFYTLLSHFPPETRNSFDPEASSLNRELKEKKEEPLAERNSTLHPRILTPTEMPDISIAKVNDNDQGVDNSRGLKLKTYTFDGDQNNFITPQEISKERQCETFTKETNGQRLWLNWDHESTINDSLIVNDKEEMIVKGDSKQIQDILPKDASVDDCAFRLLEKILAEEMEEVESLELTSPVPRCPNPSLEETPTHTIHKTFSREKFEENIFLEMPKEAINKRFSLDKSASMNEVDHSGWLQEKTVSEVPKERNHKRFSVDKDTSMNKNDFPGWSPEKPLTEVPKETTDKRFYVDKSTSFNVNDFSGWLQEKIFTEMPKETKQKRFSVDKKTSLHAIDLFGFPKGEFLSDSKENESKTYLIDKAKAFSSAAQNYAQRIVNDVIEVANQMTESSRNIFSPLLSRENSLNDRPFQDVAREAKKQNYVSDVQQGNVLNDCARERNGEADENPRLMIAFDITEFSNCMKAKIAHLLSLDSSQGVETFQVDRKPTMFKNEKAILSILAECCSQASRNMVQSDSAEQKATEDVKVSSQMKISKSTQDDQKEDSHVSDFIYDSIKAAMVNIDIQSDIKDSKCVDDVTRSDEVEHAHLVRVPFQRAPSDTLGVESFLSEKVQHPEAVSEEHHVRFDQPEKETNEQKAVKLSMDNADYYFSEIEDEFLLNAKDLEFAEETWEPEHNHLLHKDRLLPPHVLEVREVVGGSLNVYTEKWHDYHEDKKTKKTETECRCCSSVTDLDAIDAYKEGYDWWKMKNVPATYNIALEDSDLKNQGLENIRPVPLPHETDNDDTIPTSSWPGTYPFTAEESSKRRSSLQSPTFEWILVNKMWIFLDDIKKNGYCVGPPLVLKLHRQQYLEEAYQTLMCPSNVPLCYYRDLRVVFKDERGHEEANDSSQELFTLLSQQLFTRFHLKLFEHPSEDTMCLHLNPASPSDLKWFQFAGVVLGLSFMHRKQLGIPLPEAFYKCLLDRALTVLDVAEIDPLLYKKLEWLKKNRVSTYNPKLTFTVREKFGVICYDHELIPEGNKVLVTDGNKFGYIEKAVKWKLAGRYLEQMKEFRKGLSKVLEPFLLSVFTPEDLKQMIARLPEYGPLQCDGKTPERRETW